MGTPSIRNSHPALEFTSRLQLSGVPTYGWMAAWLRPWGKVRTSGKVRKINQQKITNKKSPKVACYPGRLLKRRAIAGMFHLPGIHLSAAATADHARSHGEAMVTPPLTPHRQLAHSASFTYNFQRSTPGSRRRRERSYFQPMLAVLLFVVLIIVYQYCVSLLGLRAPCARCLVASPRLALKNNGLFPLQPHMWKTPPYPSAH